MEKFNNQCWRSTYLRKIAKARTDGKEIVYLDETWFNCGENDRRQWSVPPWSLKRWLPSPFRGGKIETWPLAMLTFILR